MSDTHERIKVWIRYENGKTACMCAKRCKKCSRKDCEEDVVFRDRYRGWRDCFRQDRYGLSR